MTGELLYFILGIAALSLSIMLPLLVFQHIENRKIRSELLNSNQMIKELKLSSNTHEAKYKSINAQLSLIGSKIAPENYRRLHQKMSDTSRTIKDERLIGQANPPLCNRTGKTPC